MITTILESFDIWTRSQTIKSNGRTAGVENQRLLGIDKLRELILELAVRGKLVPQDEKDEPAKKILNHLSTKGEKISSVSSSINLPFSLPPNWDWVYLSDVSTIVGGGTPKTDVSKYWAENEISWLTPADLYSLKEKYIYKGRRDISKEGLNSSSATLLPKGTVLFSSRAPIGYVAIAGKELSTNQGFKSCVPVITEMNEFIYYFLIRSAKEIEKNASGTTFKEISGAGMSKILFPLPPLAEQHRIVAKVEELMALCDQLEQQQTSTNATHHQLVELLLQNLTGATCPEAFATAWQRIATNFDTLFTTEYSIDQLKQTILQLAVMGNLVTQDPQDEPARELLKKIAKEKERLVKEGKIKKQEKLPEITEEEKPFELPKGWEWVRWDQIALKIGDIDHKMPEEVLEGYPYVSPRDFLPNNRIDFKGAKKISKEDFMRLSEKTQPQKGDIIYPRYGTIGENRLVEDEIDFLASYSCCIIKTLHGFINPVYQFLFSISICAKNQAKAAENKTTQANVGIKSIQNFLFPLPPQSEQHRIVAKVDELFALCDALKERIKEAQETQGKLAEGVVDLQLK